VLRTRIVTAVVLAIVVLGFLFGLPPAAGVALIALVMLGGAWEWAQFAGFRRPPGRLAFTLALAGLGALAWWQTADWTAWQALMAVAALWWFVAYLWLALRPHAIVRATVAIAGVLTLVPTWVALGRLLLIEHPVRGSQYLLYVLFIVWAADIGAYFAGRAFGRLKLAPAVSPNKTWEGFLGGVAGTLLIAVAGANWFGLPRLPFVALGLAVGLASVVGDLTESLFKRYAGLKDSGSLLPGHGGVLDRIDSITAAAPFFVLGLGWLGVLP